MPGHIDQKGGAFTRVPHHKPHPLTPYPPLVINACLSGMVPTKKSTRFVPVSEEEIIADAVNVYDAGARIAHIHAFDRKGFPTWKASVYERILTGIRRERPELILCVSCSGRHWSEFEKRTEVLQLSGMAKPDMASLTLGSMNFASGANLSSIDLIIRMAETMKKFKIKPELEVFDLGMIGFAGYLEQKGCLVGKQYFNLMLGSLGQIPATIGNLAAMINSLPENSFWAAAGLGQFQLPMNMAAIVAGGGVRVGIEDYFYMDFSRHTLATNEALVKRIVRIAHDVERRVATPAEARELTGLRNEKRMPYVHKEES